MPCIYYSANDNLTEQELHSMQLLNDTLVYSATEKRFTCKLLFKKDAVPVNNYKNAVARLKSVWTMLKKDSKKRDAYKEAIQKLIDDKRVVRISEKENAKTLTKAKQVTNKGNSLF